MSKTLLEVNNLKKYFKTKNGLLHAVDDVSFTIEEGKTLGVVGESGCGKSTLGRVTLRLLEHTDGEVKFEGKDVLAMSKSEMRQMRKQMQIIFQDPYESINPRMSIGELIAEPLIVNNICKKSEINARVAELMDTVGLAERLINSYPHELDGGRRQRIGIARALSVNPKFIVCDEPVSALDVSIQSQVLNLMSDLREQLDLTYIFIAHDLSVVEHISDRIGVMYLGNFVEISDKKDMYKNPKHPYTQALLSAVPVPDPTVKKERIILEGNIPSPINAPSGCKFHPRCHKCMEICKHEAPPLVQVTPDHAVYCHLYRDE